MLPNVDSALKQIIPVPHTKEEIRTGYDVVAGYRQRYCEEHKHERWLEDTKFFVHDPDWDHRLLSIQSAHDGNHPVWKVAHVLARFGYIASATSPLSSLFMF